MEYRLLADPDSDLTELLAREFNVEFMRARNAARKLSFDAFAENYDTLENLVGDYIAKEVVKNGAFLEYRNGSLDEYLNLAREAINKPGKKIKQPRIFYSLSSLKKYLNNSGNENGIAFDINKLNLSRNRLFSSDDKQAQLYLDSLIRNGKISVSTHEHWCKSKDEGTGPRSFHILRKVSFSLNMAFSELKLERPEISTNSNKMTLEIDERTKDYLRKIREELKKKSNS
jgi:hypothetical protein